MGYAKVSQTGGREITFSLYHFVTFCIISDLGAGGHWDWTADGPPPELVRLGQCRRRGNVREREDVIGRAKRS